MTRFEREMAADAIALHAAAEARWKALREAIQPERVSRAAAAAGASTHEWAALCAGWADALDWVLTLMNGPAQTTRTTAAEAGKEKAT